MAQRADLGRRQIALDVLAVREQAIEGRACRIPVVDDAHTAAFPARAGRPSYLAQAAGPSNDWTLLRTKHQRELKRAVGVIRQILADQAREDSRLDEVHEEVYAIDV